MITWRRWTAILGGVLAVGLIVLQGNATLADKEVTVTDKENNTKVKLDKGDTLILKLSANPTTGFLWAVAKNNDEQLKQQGKTEFLKPDKKLIGAPTTQVYRFKAEKAGTSDLELHYKRPFEKGKEPAKTFKVTVEVGGGL